ncbi:MAG: FAD-binding protein [Bacteroidales bacterium]|nr:FAD-binding protein [Bacteroidales bacterium]
MKEKLKILGRKLKGDVFFDDISLLLYSTDASAYKERPIAVTRPKTSEDIKEIINFARENNVTIIPRTAGTSLAGQVVGNGIIVDVSKYLTEILEFNKEEKWVRVQPGVVLDELNLYLKPHGLFFGPETSTANRCMIGGMVGNNACGLHSLIYGSTRDHLLEVKAILSDGSDVEFKSLSNDEFAEKCMVKSLEGKIYKQIDQLLNNKEIQDEIRREYPAKEVKRRNTGYALDLLLESSPFSDTDEKFNFCKLIAGSEGTLAFLTEITLNLVPLPPKEKAVICVHFHTVNESLLGNLIALKHRPDAVELMDDVIMNCTKGNIEQRKNRFFIEGDPGAILIIEFTRETREEIEVIKKKLEEDMRKEKLGYHFPIVWGKDINRVWNLRKAGLGLLSNVPGDAKPVSVVEDTAVMPQVLPEYIADFQALLKKYNLNSVYHAHIATGELHLRPMLDLKLEKDVELFHTIALEVAKLVKKHKGSLSGEHGDGRLRGEFIPLMLGEKIYRLLKEIKVTWDPNNILNAGKIVDTPQMNKQLRYLPGTPTREIETIFDFSDVDGILRLAEKCNGSGDCRKSALIGGTMCPSYMATRDENTTTRARANVLREFLTNSNKKNPFAHDEIYQILDLCLSCKGCKSECPSNVDMAKLKAEFLQHYYDAHHIPLRTRVIAYITNINKLGSIMPSVFNFFITNSFTSSIAKKILKFAPKRSIPKLYKTTLRRWASKNLKSLNEVVSENKKVYLFIDEFTNYNDTAIGITTIKLLNKLGYKVEILNHAVSGRTFFSKGLIRTGKKVAIKNVSIFKDIVTPETPLVGIEPSAILSFRDEYPDLVGRELKQEAIELGKSTLIIDEFIARDIDKGNITSDMFTQVDQKIKLHGHCQQKSVASTEPTKKMLSLPKNYVVEEIKSGCCGMAGSFGYEKEHYDLSMKVGELVLFPEVRNASDDTIISAPGTSCRHQIKDGTGKEALHPVEVLYKALV